MRVPKALVVLVLAYFAIIIYTMMSVVILSPSYDIFTHMSVLVI